MLGSPVSQADQEVSSQISDVLALVGRRFVESLHQRVLELEAAATALRQGGSQPEQLAAISMIAHKIAGVAPTVGFVRIGEKARMVENAIGRAPTPEQAEATWRAVERDFEQFMNDLEALLDKT